jgi:maleylacetoacetate isomerase
MGKITLYDYWRSSAAYRVRIALNLKNLEYDTVVINLLEAEHKNSEYRDKNPQAIVPAIDIDDQTFTQSLAIIEYLDEIYPEPLLLSPDPQQRVRIRALSYAIAMEIHPICNLSVVVHVAELTQGGDQAKLDWMKKFIRAGLQSFEACLDDGKTGTFCNGDQVSMADCCLIPQLYNAQRWGIDYSDLIKISAIEKACGEISAFYDAFPDRCQ